MGAEGRGSGWGCVVREKQARAHFSCRQPSTRAEPGGTLLQKLWRSSKHASASLGENRMSLAAMAKELCTAEMHSSSFSSNLRPHPRTTSLSFHPAMKEHFQNRASG